MPSSSMVRRLPVAVQGSIEAFAIIGPVHTYGRSKLLVPRQSPFLGSRESEPRMSNELSMHATTIVTVRKGNKVVIAGDGQVSLGQTIMKGNARKVRRIGANGNVIA